MLSFPSKIIHEDRQGEALSILPNHDGKKQTNKFLYIESYGCQMNFNDSEIVAALLQEKGYTITQSIQEASVIFLNTCAIRDKAEQAIRKRLTELQVYKKKNPTLLIGVLGCMAERIKAKLLEEEKLIDIVAGPDAYRSLPMLLTQAEMGQKAVNVLLSREETYADVTPIQLHSNGVNAFLSIMRGCNNMCSFCVVPFTRGRERSRSPHTIVKEAKDLFSKGYRDITLLGQNVDSYLWTCNETNENIDFANLLVQVAKIHPLLRVRFSTSHPKDITDNVLYAMRDYDNICKYIHLPIQSGSTRILSLMNRTYSWEWYKNKVNRIREIVPDAGLSSDIITGFCTETEEDHQLTLDAMRYCCYDLSYMFAYSERPGTPAQKNLPDDVPLAIKKKRLEEVVHLQNELSLQSNQKEVGKEFVVLIEGDSKRSDQDWLGRTSHNKVVIFPKAISSIDLKGSYTKVRVHHCTKATLLGTMVF